MSPSQQRATIFFRDLDMDTLIEKRKHFITNIIIIIIIIIIITILLLLLLSLLLLLLLLFEIEIKLFILKNKILFSFESIFSYS